MDRQILMSDGRQRIISMIHTEKKIFFTDLDDTLLTDDKQITEGNRRALDRILEEGHQIVFCTGRVLHSAATAVKKLDYYRTGCFLSCYNGGQIFQIDGKKSLYIKTLPRDLVEMCVRTAAEEDIHIQAYASYDAGIVLARKPSPHLDTYCRVQALEKRIVPDIMEAIDRDPPKLLAIEPDTEKMDHFRARLHAAAGDRMDLFMSSASYLEMVPPGVNKGNAVRYLCKYLGIPIENCIAAGDAENDISMIVAAGVGAAVANAQERVRASADYVTQRDHNHDAVEEILDKFI